MSAFDAANRQVAAGAACPGCDEVIRGLRRRPCALRLS
jgi:hypothetical protein